jgi:formylglycine-generating enzyme required for sulfatase activity
MIELLISKTCKFAPRSPWQRYDDERKSFPDKAAAQAWLKEEYGNAKRSACYVDGKDGGAPQRVGYVIGFRCKWRSAGEPYLEQHWIEFRECRAINPTA